jgi:hypothetical protein
MLALQITNIHIIVVQISKNSYGSDLLLSKIGVLCVMQANTIIKLCRNFIYMFQPIFMAIIRWLHRLGKSESIFL